MTRRDYINYHLSRGHIIQDLVHHNLESLRYSEIISRVKDSLEQELQRFDAEALTDLYEQAFFEEVPHDEV